RLGQLRRLVRTLLLSRLRWRLGRLAQQRPGDTLERVHRQLLHPAQSSLAPFHSSASPGHRLADSVQPSADQTISRDSLSRKRRRGGWQEGEGTANRGSAPPPSPQPPPPPPPLAA